MFKNKSQKGFTLAEVLITLGIIGVVAAMTIPTLMVDINTKQWSTAKNVFEKKLNESLKTMNTQQTISGHTTTLSFVEELSKHYKINKICSNDKLQDCFSETVYWGAGEATPEAVDMTTIKQASHFGLEDWGTELIGVQFANGVSGLVAYNPACSGDPYSNQFKGTECISMLYDVSGSKNPNTSGKDLGNYGVINRLGGATCAIEIDGTCFTAPFDPPIMSFEECEAVKSELGIEYCAGDEYMGDSWAGAVAKCGHVSKLPTREDLAKLANYLYNVDYIYPNDSSFENLSRDPQRAASLGFPESDIHIWSNDDSMMFAYAWLFGTNRAYDFDDQLKRTSSVMAICIQ